MTVDAEVALLFSSSPNVIPIPSVIDLSMAEDADLHYWISPTGQLEYCSAARASPLLGEPSLEGHLWLGSLGRHWTPDDPEYGGNPRAYAEALRTLLHMSGVEYVWYGVLTVGGGSGDVPAVTEDWITSFFQMSA